MNVERVLRRGRLLWRVETIVAEIRMRHAMARTGVAAFALFIGALGAAGLSVAAFFALEPQWGRAWAAAAVGGALCVLGALVLAAASRMRPGREYELANEVRQSAVTALEEDVRAMFADFGSLAHAVRHPFDVPGLAGLVVPVVAIVLKALKKTDNATPG